MPNGCADNALQPAAAGRGVIEDSWSQSLFELGLNASDLEETARLYGEADAYLKPDGWCTPGRFVHRRSDQPSRTGWTVCAAAWI